MISVIKHWDRLPRHMVGAHGNITGQDGQGCEQPDLAEDGPVHCRGVGLCGL